MSLFCSMDLSKPINEKEHKMSNSQRFVVKLERKFIENNLQWHIVATYNDDSTYLLNSGLTERGSKSVFTKAIKTFDLEKSSPDVAVPFDFCYGSSDDLEEKPTLKSGLERIVDLVEKADIDDFYMGNWDNCVIGKTIGWEKSEFEIYDWKTINQIFGLNFDFNETAVSQNRHRCYSDEQWAVIRLFTSDIQSEGCLTKQQWLELAKSQLEEMK